MPSHTNLEGPAPSGHRPREPTRPDESRPRRALEDRRRRAFPKGTDCRSTPARTWTRWPTSRTPGHVQRPAGRPGRAGSVPCARSPPTVLFRSRPRALRLVPDPSRVEPGQGRTSADEQGCRWGRACERISGHAQVKELERGESAGKPDSVGPRRDRTVIHLGPPLPATSVRSTRGLGRAALEHPRGSPEAPFLTLLRVGFTKPSGSLRPLVVSYTTVSPLPPRAVAVCFLWHCPAGHPGSVLPTTLPCGVRTFLEPAHLARAATVWPTPLAPHSTPFRASPGPPRTPVQSRWAVSLRERTTIGPSE